MTGAESTGWPSSVTAIAPASRSSHISVISRPSSPFVIAAAGITTVPQASRALCRMRSTTLRLSTTGLVLGIVRTWVKPPRAAAMAPVAIVSASSSPGSRKWTCMSWSPGVRIQPSAGRTRASTPAGSFGSIASIFPDRIHTSRRSSIPFSGSTTLTPSRTKLCDGFAIVIPGLPRGPAEGPPRPSSHRARGRAPPSARRPRWSPGPGSPTRGRRRHRSRFPRPCSSDRGA